MEKIAAGIVLYNPNIVLLKRNISAVIKQVGYLILIDNNSTNIQEIQELISSFGSDHIDLTINSDNRGIAFALNQTLTKSIENGCDWLLTLDQDSVCDDNLIKEYMKFIGNNIGQITCNIYDKNFGAIDSVNKDTTGPLKIDYCITSGALNNCRALLAVGGYTNELFIDGVDLDISCKLRSNGYSVIRINYNGLIHELGDSKKVHFLGKLVSITHHQPWRNYYMRRNMIYVYRKYYSGVKQISLITKQVYYAIGAIILEDNKIDRLKNNILGIIHGFKMSI